MPDGADVMNRGWAQVGEPEVTRGGAAWLPDTLARDVPEAGDADIA